MSMNESVLVIPANAMDRFGPFTGFRADLGDRLHELLNPAHLLFRPRASVETDPSFKQLIPYVVFRWGDELFHYTRGSGAGEARLRAKRSIGIGGHINSADAHGQGDLYRSGMRRELAEEVNIDSRFSERIIGLVYDPTTPVGQVHLGIVHLVTLERPAVEPREAELMEAGFAPMRELWERRAEFESWSQVVLESLLSDSIFPQVQWAAGPSY